jgi:hypothetical protein
MVPPPRLLTAKLEDFIAGGAADQDFEQILQDVQSDGQLAVGFRGNQSASVIALQDMTLRNYRLFLRAENTFLRDFDDEEIDIHCFPTDHRLFFEQARQYLIFVIACTTPRSLDDSHVSYSTAAQWPSCDHLLVDVQV